MANSIPDSIHVDKAENGFSVTSHRDGKEGGPMMKPPKKHVFNDRASVLEHIGHELKSNPPKVLASTARKYGAKRAQKQKTAILLSKARAAGVHIPGG